MSTEETPPKMTVVDWRKAEGLEDEDEFQARLEEIVSDAVCPVLCTDPDCGDVEPDGECQHGNPSLLIELGLI